MMTDVEIRDALKFTSKWFELGLVDEAQVAAAVREYRESGDQNDEHYRWAAFQRFLDLRPVLTPQQCVDLFNLGADDPDWTMGATMMLQVLQRKESPYELHVRAAAHPRTEKYAAEMKRRRDFDPESHRKALQSLGAERYFAAHAFHEDGRPRKNQLVYLEMRNLFGIDFAEFRRIRDAEDQRRG